MKNFSIGDYITVYAKVVNIQPAEETFDIKIIGGPKNFTMRCDFAAAKTKLSKQKSMIIKLEDE